MSDPDVRAELQARNDELEAELGALMQIPTDQAGTVSFGKRIGEGTSLAVERLAQTSAARALWGKLQQVRRALEKLDEDSYGRCDECGAAIECERLDAIPWAVRCVRCARAGAR